MKKIISLLLAAVLTGTMFAGCTRNKTDNNDNNSNNGNNTATAKSALEVLQTVWDKFNENEKFPVYGGSGDDMVDGNPGQCSIRDTDGLCNNLLVPEEQLASIDQAASIVNGMMVNNFTCGAYRLKDGADETAFARGLRDAFKNNQWLCGTPEQLLVAVIDGRYVLAAFGLNDVLALLQTKLQDAYPNAQVKYFESIA